MGGIADAILDGEVCQLCCTPFEVEKGTATLCRLCEDRDAPKIADHKQYAINEAKQYLKEACLGWETANGGVHLQVTKGGAIVADLWPTTGRWRMRNSNQKGEGVLCLIVEING